jgi:hypothetical protein
VLRARLVVLGTKDRVLGTKEDVLEAG